MRTYEHKNDKTFLLQNKTWKAFCLTFEKINCIFFFNWKKLFNFCPQGFIFDSHNLFYSRFLQWIKIYLLYVSMCWTQFNTKNAFPLTMHKSTIGIIKKWKWYLRLKNAFLTSMQPLKWLSFSFFVAERKILHYFRFMYFL